MLHIFNKVNAICYATDILTKPCSPLIYIIIILTIPLFCLCLVLQGNHETDPHCRHTTCIAIYSILRAGSLVYELT